MEVTIEITDYCPNNCDYCSTNATFHGMPLNIDVIKKFLWDFRMEYGAPSRINISGGEPVSHPDFYEILKLCKSYTENVWLYTNMITQIMYNTDIVKEIKVEANVCLVPGREVYIPKNADKVHLLQLVKQGRAKDMQPAKFHVSGNMLDGNGCGSCKNCKHILLQANGKIVKAPCKKDY